MSQIQTEECPKTGPFLFFESSQQNSRCILLGSNFIYILCTCINLACWGCFFLLILRWLFVCWQARQKNQENPFFKNTGVGFTGLSFAISLWWKIYWYIAPLLGWFRLWPWHRFTRDFLIVYIIPKAWPTMWI